MFRKRKASSNRGATIVAKNIDASMAAVNVTNPPLQSAVDAALADNYWRSLRYFSVYRLIIGAVFLIAFLVSGGGSLTSENPVFFLWADAAYMALALVFLIAVWRIRRVFNLQLSLQVVCDVIFLATLMYASGGANGGIAFMLVVAVAGAALVGKGRLTLFFAALATLAVLVEQFVRSLTFGASSDDFFNTGLICIGFFATALIVRMLSKRVVANEELAQQRGIELADQV
ncbi:MAG: hypothetical protein LBP94_02080, partial [Zoogloeaceae bacterium]|nr:hypothetical protein [Zoogloeaceae bacterium]